MLSIFSHVKFMKLTPQPNPNPHLCLTEYFQLTFTLTFNYYIFLTKKHTKTTLIRDFLINLSYKKTRNEPDEIRNPGEHFAGRILLLDLSVDPTDELEIMRVGHFRDGNELADRTSRVEAFSQLPRMTFGL